MKFMNSRQKGISSAIISAVFLGLAPVFGKSAMILGFSPLALVAIRTFLAASLLLILIVITTVSSKEADEKYVNTLTRILIPIVIKLSEKIQPVSTDNETITIDQPELDGQPGKKPCGRQHKYHGHGNYQMRNRQWNLENKMNETVFLQKRDQNQCQNNAEGSGDGGGCRRYIQGQHQAVQKVRIREHVCKMFKGQRV